MITTINLRSVILTTGRIPQSLMVKKDSSGKLKFAFPLRPATSVPSSQPTLIPRRPCARSLSTLGTTLATMATIACTPPGSTLPETLDNHAPPTRDVWSPFFHLSYLNHSITVGVYFRINPPFIVARMNKCFIFAPSSFRYLNSFVRVKVVGRG